MFSNIVFLVFEFINATMDFGHFEKGFIYISIYEGLVDKPPK